MIFTKRLRDGVRRGTITCSVRIWTRPHVKAGSRYRMDEGEIEVDSIEPIDILRYHLGAGAKVRLLECGRPARDREARSRRKHLSGPVPLCASGETFDAAKGCVSSLAICYPAGSERTLSGVRARSARGARRCRAALDVRGRRVVPAGPFLRDPRGRCSLSQGGRRDSPEVRGGWIEAVQALFESKWHDELLLCSGGSAGERARTCPVGSSCHRRREPSEWTSSRKERAFVATTSFSSARRRQSASCPSDRRTPG